MRSGALVKRVELWRKSATKNSFGELYENWSKIKDLRSYTYRKRGRQIINTDEVFDLIKIEISIRNQYDIRESDRIKYFNNMYDITFIQPLDQQERWLKIYCTRVNE